MGDFDVKKQVLFSNEKEGKTFQAYGETQLFITSDSWTNSDHDLTATLQFKSPNEGSSEDWMDFVIFNPNTGFHKIEADRNSIITFPAVIGIQYRVVSNVAGPEATRILAPTTVRRRS